MPLALLRFGWSSLWSRPHPVAAQAFARLPGRAVDLRGGNHPPMKSKGVRHGSRRQHPGQDRRRQGQGQGGHGRATGDKREQAEGQGEQSKAKLKETGDQARDAAKNRRRGFPPLTPASQLTS
jgi:Uncharacterized protein conserved in bacteria